MFINSLPNDVSWFSSAQVGAPQMLGGSNGDLLRVLDACLVSGFGEKSVLNVTTNGNSVTLDFGVGHGYLERQVILVSGANDSLLNGRHRILSATNNSVTVSITGVITTAGAILVKAAPLNWESVFGSADPLKRAYRSKSSTSNKRVLFLDMSYGSSSGYHATSPAKRASVSVCEDMTTLGVQVNSLTDTINKFQSNPNGSLFWYQKRGSTKADAVPNTATPWKIIGNSDFFFLVIGWSSASAFEGTIRCDVFGFGEFAGIGDALADNQFLIAMENNNDDRTSLTPDFGAYFTSSTTGTIYDPSVYCMSNGGFSKKPLSIITAVDANLALQSGTSSLVYPNPTGSALFTHPIRVGRGSSGLMGVVPCIMFLESNVSSGGASYDGVVVDGVVLVHVQHRPTFSSYTPAYYAFYLGD